MSLVKTAAGSAEYYIEYAVDGAERPGEWMGEGAEELGLKGYVEPEALRNLFKGMRPDGTGPLINLAAIRNDRQHTPAWDLCLSPPKDVSLLAGLFDEMKVLVNLCQREAVRTTVDYAEKEAAFVRRGKGGERLEKAKLVIAAYEHHTNRNDQPQEHTHLLVINAAAHRNGFGSIVSKFLYDRQTALQNVYLAALAVALVRELGLVLEGVESKPFVPGEAFNVVGIPDPLRKYMSSRRAEILAMREKFGITTARGMDRAAQSTKKEKSHLPQSVLRPVWKNVPQALGYDLSELRAAVQNAATIHQQQREKPNVAKETAGQQTAKLAEEGRPSQEASQKPQEVARKTQGETPRTEATNVRQFPPRQPTAENGAENTAEDTAARTAEQTREKPAEEAAERAGEKVEEKTTTSARPQATVSNEAISDRIAASMIESITRSAVAAKLPTPMIDRLMDQVLEDFDRQHRPEKIGKVKERSAAAVKALPELLEVAEQLKQETRHVVPRDQITRGLSGKITSRTADEALVQAMESTGAVACIEAKAGTDTNQFVSAMAREYQKAGFKVKAFTATSTAASELQTAIGMPVHTVGQLLPRLKTAPLAEALHHAAQILKEAVNFSTKSLWHFNNQTIAIVTQAQSLRTVELLKILTEAKAANAKVVLVGSSTELPRREPHRAFAEVAGKVGSVALSDPVVQAQEWMKDAVQQVARGDARGAYSQYVLADRLHLAPNQRAATIELINHWAKLSREEQDGKTLIIAGSDRDARVLNKLAQQVRKKEGIPRLLRQKIDGTWVRRGDRVLFRSGSKYHGIRAGDMGTIQRIGLNGMRIKLDRTRWAPLVRPNIRIEVPKSLYRGMTLGYAVSATDAQGLRPDNTLLLPKAGGDHIEGLSVQLSRASEDARIFTSTRSVGEDVEAIHRSFQAQAREQENQRAAAVEKAAVVQSAAEKAAAAVEREQTKAKDVEQKKEEKHKHKESFAIRP
jgi:conjugative relaxase-like TrwC/TraI family protein